jgi:SAM-dependent methyltransferase
MQYAKSFTDALQFLWGEGFLSPGGPEEVAEMIGGLDISHWRVLDIGSGLGGVDILLAERHRAGEIIGIDVEGQLVDAATELAVAKGVPGPLPFPDASFDLVFSRTRWSISTISNSCSARCCAC